MKMKKKVLAYLFGVMGTDLKETGTKVKSVERGSDTSQTEIVLKESSRTENKQEREEHFLPMEISTRASGWTREDMEVV